MVVEWTDAARAPDQDCDPADLAITGLVVNRTYGLLIYEDRHEVKLVQDESAAENTVRFPYSIPQSLVKRMIVILPAPDKEKLFTRPQPPAETSIN